VPDDLFYPKGVVCCILIFKAHIPHNTNGTFKTWFGYWKDDGHIKVKHRGRVDVHEKWKKIKIEWLTAYQNREVVAGKSVAKNVSASDEWCAEAFMETDYSQIQKNDFEKVVRDYAIFKLTNTL
jgi:type I restriction-modification system DNA methylase subunit